MLSATPANSRRIISKIREQLKFIGSSHFASQDKNKLKGKSLLDSTDASILDTLRSGLRFKSVSFLSVSFLFWKKMSVSY